MPLQVRLAATKEVFFRTKKPGGQLRISAHSLFCASGDARAAFGFEYGAWEISPQLDVDFVDGESTFVLGVTFGKGF
jgi:hypothetical protein